MTFTAYMFVWLCVCVCVFVCVCDSLFFSCRTCVVTWSHTESTFWLNCIFFFLSPFVSRFPDDDDDGKATTQPLLKKGRRSTLLGCIKISLLLFLLGFILHSVLVVCSFPLTSYFPFLLLSFLYHLILHSIFWIPLVLTSRPAPCCLCLVSFHVCPAFQALLATWLWRITFTLFFSFSFPPVDSLLLVAQARSLMLYCMS